MNIERDRVDVHRVWAIAEDTAGMWVVKKDVQRRRLVAMQTAGDRDITLMVTGIDIVTVHGFPPSARGAVFGILSIAL
jgi:hypothetical protein